VAGHAIELARQDADVFRAARHLDVEQLLERHDAGPLAEQRADVLERVEVADRLVVVGVLAQLLDAPMQVAEDRVEIDDLLAVELEDHSEHAMGRRMLGSHVEEHLAVPQGVELGLALRARRVRRHRLEDAEIAIELDAGIVGLTREGVVAEAAGVRPCVGSGGRGGHRGVPEVPAPMRRTGAARGVSLGAWVRSIGRTPAPGERAASSAR